MADKVHVKKGDTVTVISGKDNGKKGKVLSVYPKDRKVIVEGINMSTKHKKPRGRYQQGGIISQESPLNISNVMLICPRCSEPSRTGKKINSDGQKERFCKKCNEVVDIMREAKQDRN